MKFARFNVFDRELYGNRDHYFIILRLDDISYIEQNDEDPEARIISLRNNEFFETEESLETIMNKIEDK